MMLGGIRTLLVTQDEYLWTSGLSASGVVGQMTLTLAAPPVMKGGSYSPVVAGTGSYEPIVAKRGSSG